MYATVQRIESIRPHPDETRTKIEVVKLKSGVELVTGKHYRAGLLGIFLAAGCWIPGWLAEDLWLVGKKRSSDPFEVRSINIFGVESPGLFCGAEYMNDGSDASLERYRKLEAEGGERRQRPAVPGATFDWITWPRWRSHWQEGQVLDGYLGVMPAAIFSGAHYMPIPHSVPLPVASGAFAAGGSGHWFGGTTDPASSATARVTGLPDVPPNWEFGGETVYCSVCGCVKANPPSQSHSIMCRCAQPTAAEGQ